MTLKHIDFRVLKKLQLLKYLNVAKNISFNEHKLVIPVLNGLGYPNLFLKPNWLYSIINELFETDGEGFVDVGANIGQTLIAIKTANRRIQYIGFEPSVSCCYYLKTLINKNNFDNCRVYNFALSSELKEMVLETNGEADPTGSTVSALRPSFFKQRESIFSIDHDRLHLEQKVTCIKIDVEGGELETLEGMQNLIRRDRPFILCEVLDSFSDDVLTFTQERADKVVQILVRQDYSIIHIVQDAETEQIVSFNEIDVIKITQWRQESLQLNDYIFYPSEKRPIIRRVLTKICC